MHLCAHTFNWWDANISANGCKFPFWMVYSCLTGAYDWVPASGDTLTADCLGERLLHNSGMNGAIGYFGATELSHPSAWTYLGTYMWRAFFQHNMHTPGEAIAYAKLWSASGAGGADDPLMFNLLGDPAIDLFLTDSQGYGTYPDYVVRSTEMSATPDLVSCGESVHLKARVRNTSNCRVDDDVKVLFQMCERDGSGCSPVDSFFVRVPAWGYVDGESWWTPGVADAGHRRFRVVVDPQNAWPELHEDNNAAMIDVGVLPDATGFPVSLGGEGGLSPVVTDIDSDEEPEIVAAVRDPGRVSVLSPSGDEEWFFDPHSSQVLRGPVACGDLDGNDTLEVVVCYGDSVSARRGADGKAAWSTRRRYVQGLNSGAVLADVSNGDGKLEVLVARAYLQMPAWVWKGQLLALKGDGTGGQWSSQVVSPVKIFQAQTDRSGASGDLDGDGLGNALYTCAVTTSGYRARALKANGQPLWTDYLNEDEEDLLAPPCDPVLADVVPGSPGLETLWGADLLRCVSHDGAQIWDCPISGYIGGVAVSDLDDDGDLDVVASTYGSPGDPDDCAGHICVLDADGAILGSVALDYAAKAAPVVADLDGGRPEILVTSSCFEYVPSDTMRWVSHLDAFTLTEGALARSDALSRPQLFWGEMTTAPCVADVDGDSLLEVVLVDGDGNVHCLENQGWSGGTPSRWACYQHDERHTGTYETPVTGVYPAGTTASWWGDYYMTGDVTVDSTSTLVVQPGTTVRVAPLQDDQSSGIYEDRVELTVLRGQGGELRIGGDPLRPVAFTSAAESPQPEDWVGIRLRERSTGVIENAAISHAQDAIYAYKPDTLRVTDSTILETGVRGIRCRSNTATHQVLVRGNAISGAILGIDLTDCAADIDGNTVADCSAYGMQIVGDEGSSVHDNQVVRPTYGYMSFSGIYVQDSRADLVIAHNTIGDSLYGIPNVGIHYKSSASSDTAMIKNNTIIGSDDPKATAMYFYNGKPTVRANTLTGSTFSTAYYVAGFGRKLPHLGEAAGDTTCGCLGDTTQPGCNRLVPDEAADVYAYAAASLLDTLMAECNYWYPEPDIKVKRFYGDVAWRPYLRSDPGGGRGLPAEDGAHEQLATLALLPNTPNPFNPETVFRFALPQAGQVRLEVYDLAGRHVRTLVEGPVSIGWHTATWDGRSDGGERVASGVYFCRLEVGNRELSRKVVVLK